LKQERELLKIEIMKKSFTLTLILFSIIITSIAQSDLITIDNSGLGYRFYQNNQMLGLKQLQQAVISNRQAFEKVNAARNYKVMASIIGAPGGFLIGWQFGATIAGGEPNWLMAGIGAGLILVSIPISSAAKKQAIEGMEIYNSSLEDISYKKNKTKPEFSFGTTSEGIGVRMRF